MENQLHERRTPAAQQVRVLIVDAHPSFRLAVKALLRTEGLAVVADLDRYEGAEDVANGLRPDVVLIDVSPQQTEGLELARRLSQRAQPPTIVLISAAPSDTILATTAGADCFLPKAGITADTIAQTARNALMTQSQHKEPGMTTEDNLAFAKNVLDADDWPRLIDRLANDAVFSVTIPDGTPISGEVRGKQAIADFLANVGDLLEFRREKAYEYYGGGERVVVLGQETVEVKKSGVTVPHSEFVNVLDFREGLITRFLIIQDMSAFVDAYRDD